jgi:hypothetical protein
LIVGGEEVDIDIFDQQDSPAAPASKTPPVTANVEELPEHTKLIWRGSSNPISPG